MPKPKGLPKTGGRQKGSKNKGNPERKAALDALAERVEAVIPKAFAGDSHAYLMAIYKDPSIETAVRIEAAKAAIAYEKPRLAPIEVKPQEDDHVPLAERIKSYLRDDAIEASAGKIVALRK